MRNIGSSIIDAIDWTQDTLRSTRPLAEAVLFSLMASKQVRETEAGYLLEAEDEEVMRHRHVKLHQRRRGGHRRHSVVVQKGDSGRGDQDDDDDVDELE